MNLFDLCVYKNLNKGSGGNVDVSSLVATENKTYNAGEGKAYNPVVVNVPEKKLTTLNADENKTYSPPSGYDGFSEVEVYVPYVTQGTTINENGDYTPPAGVDGFGRVIVDVPTPPPSLQSLTASHNGYFVPSSGYVGFSEVNVDVALPQNAYLLESQKDDVVTIQHGAEFDMPKLIVSIEPQQSGSGDPSPENVRPISGWTACNVVRSGANIWAEEWELGIYNTSTGEKQADNSRIRSKNYISVRPSNSYRIVIPSSAYCRYFCYDINKNLIITEENQGSVAITTPNNCYFMTFTMGQEYGTTYNDDISVNYPSTDTSYHAYNGNTYTINFVDGSSPLTVYGGTLDVRSGVLTVTDAYYSSPLTWQKNTGWGYTFFNANSVINDKKENVACNYYKAVSKSRDSLLDGEIGTWNTTSSFIPCIRDDSKADLTAEEFTTAMSGLTFTYKLATPQIYQLTPTEVKSLLGVNNIFADTGKVDVQIWTKEVTS